jgi:hypothetical protein
MIPRRLQRIVTDDPALAALWDRTKPLRELQKLYAILVPPYLRTVTRVGAVAADELKLFADSGAAATRLRLLAPGLLAEFRSKGWQFSAIRVAVQVRSRPDPAAGSPRKSLDARGQQSLQQLADQLPESPLQAAISRLAKLK